MKNKRNNNGKMFKEKRNLKPSQKLESEKARKQREIKESVLKGKAREEKYQIYDNLSDREFNRLINMLESIQSSDENIEKLIENYIFYIIQNKDNFDYLELRKFKKGIIKAINSCVLECGASIYQKEEEFEDDYDFDEVDDELSLKRKL